MINENLKRLRESRGWSQSEISRRSGIPAATVCRIENGVVPDPKLSTVMAISRALGCGIAALVGESEPKPREVVLKKGIGTVELGQVWKPTGDGISRQKTFTQYSLWDVVAGLMALRSAA